MNNINNIRFKLIKSIEKYAGDELTLEDWIQISTENNSELINRLIFMLEYYYYKD